MKYDKFSAIFPFIAHFPLDKNNRYFAMTKPLRIWDSERDTYIKFTSLKEMWNHCFDGTKTVEQALSRIENFETSEHGGRGSGSGASQTFSFGDAGGGVPADVPQHFPVEANARIKNKTESNAISFFADKYRNADHEYGMLVDDRGFVHQYSEGGTSAVYIGSKKGTIAVHNHPSGGAFSKSDLVNTARTNRSGIIAVGSKGDYTFRKGTHFKSAAFEKAVKTAKIKGKDYDDAVRKWLTANQKKYGYKFNFKAR